MSSNMNEIKKMLDNENIKPTYERLSILQYLEKNHNHPTVAMIYEELVKKIPTISKTTVYNSLNLFMEKGIVAPLYITGSEVRYDLSTSQHHHFLCEQCGKIYDLTIDCPYLNKNTIEGHQIKQKHGYFRGICKSCLEKDKSQK
ncbi:MAG: transcriptional repressor [Candidatus Cloacimonetes bacterium]|nr:transcriptional repressor [Candidatus Cloacimonadota bacterium]